MSFFAVDDRFTANRKIMRLRLTSEHWVRSIGVWTMAGSWACGDPTARHDGVIPIDVVRGLGGCDEDIAVLVGCGLWDHVDDEHVGFHDWNHWNGPNASAERRREAEREKKRRQRSHESTVEDSTNGVVLTTPTPTPTPTPTRRPRDVPRMSRGQRRLRRFLECLPPPRRQAGGTQGMGQGGQAGRSANRDRRSLSLPRRPQPRPAVHQARIDVAERRLLGRRTPAAKA